LQQTNASMFLEADRPGSLHFFGCDTAELFSREVAASFQGVLARNYQRDSTSYMPGYVTASIDGRYWYDTMWTRDAGTFLRELVLWGYLNHACLLADCLLQLVRPNAAGYHTFPMYFQGVEPASGSELDGSAAITIGLALLWQRLPAHDPYRANIYRFLHADASPLSYIHAQLRHTPLVAGSGEFGGGMGVEGEWCNVVQNNLLRLALLAGARLESQAGDDARANLYRQDAGAIQSALRRYLVGPDGSWLWCVHPDTLQPDPAVLDSQFNAGFGGLNGIAAMDADVLGLAPTPDAWPELGVCEKTFDRLLAVPQRRQLFEDFGMWSQFDRHLAGQLTSASYGQAYALQAMLLFDRLPMAERGLDYLAQATYTPPAEYTELTRTSRYHFYERYYPPNGAVGIVMEQGCGELNLVNVAEPLKVARMIVGVDDLAGDELRLIPRLPPSWQGFEAHHWPLHTPAGLLRADIRCERRQDRLAYEITVADGARVPRLAVRLPTAQGFVWQRAQDVNAFQV
jgi:hypothetical protein